MAEDKPAIQTESQSGDQITAGNISGSKNIAIGAGAQALGIEHADVYLPPPPSAPSIRSRRRRATLLDAKHKLSSSWPTSARERQLAA